MAINSSGYDTTLYGEDEWALWHGAVRPYGVREYGDGKVTALSGAGLTCQVAAGTVYGWGVRDVITAPQNVTFGAAPSSGTRYDLVAMRRDWSGSAGGPSSIVVIPGSTTRALPTRNRNPGTLDDQPLALVPITATSASPGTPIDLRTWGVGTIRCDDIMAITAGDWPIGTQVWVGQGKNAARYEVQASGAATRSVVQIPRVPVTSPAPVSVTTNSSGAAQITHNLGWRPARMTFSFNVPGGYDKVVQIEQSSDATQTTATIATLVATVSDSTAGGPRPFVGVIGQLTWTAYEGIA